MWRAETAATQARASPLRQPRRPMPARLPLPPAPSLTPWPAPLPSILLRACRRRRERGRGGGDRAGGHCGAGGWRLFRLSRAHPQHDAAGSAGHPGAGGRALEGGEGGEERRLTPERAGLVTPVLTSPPARLSPTFPLFVSLLATCLPRSTCRWRTKMASQLTAAAAGWAAASRRSSLWAAAAAAAAPPASSAAGKQAT